MTTESDLLALFAGILLGLWIAAIFFREVPEIRFFFERRENAGSPLHANQSTNSTMSALTDSVAKLAANVGTLNTNIAALKAAIPSAEDQAAIASLPTLASQTDALVASSTIPAAPAA